MREIVRRNQIPLIADVIHFPSDAADFKAEVLRQAAELYRGGVGLRADTSRPLAGGSVGRMRRPRFHIYEGCHPATDAFDQSAGGPLSFDDLCGLLDSWLSCNFS